MNQCIICKSENNPSLYKGILKCSACRHAYADLCLSEEELFRLYSRNYFFGEEYSDYFADRRVLEKNFRLRMKVLNRWIPQSKSAKLLEIGCAYGFFLNLVRDRFASVKGFDVNPDGVDYARKELGLDVYNGDFLKQDLGKEMFDVVCLWDTIEHLQAPQLYVEKISKHTRKGALVAMTTGDIESLNAHWRKESWRLIHPPTHLHYFSKKSLAKLLDQYGFDVVYSGYGGFYRSIDNIAYHLFVLSRKQQWIYHLLKKLKVTSWDFYLNLFDIMYVIGRKRSTTPP